MEMHYSLLVIGYLEVNRYLEVGNYIIDASISVYQVIRKKEHLVLI